jgi:2-oxoacid:acceptor oxidoreductase delta subunit (pyruvate/2-ketoisovalerate family)
MSHYPPDAKWHEMEKGGVIPQAGNAVEYHVGGWRNERPIKDNECCIDCFFCWVYCPDNAIQLVDGKVKGGDIVLEHCKGCGICAKVCPKDCIKMIPEVEARSAEE